MLLFFLYYLSSCFHIYNGLEAVVELIVSEEHVFFIILLLLLLFVLLFSLLKSSITWLEEEDNELFVILLKLKLIDNFWNRIDGLLADLLKRYYYLDWLLFWTTFSWYFFVLNY